MTLIAAHRGGLAFGKHNSVQAIKETIRRKAADLIEIDVWQTKDGYVCTHGGYTGITGIWRFHKCSTKEALKKNHVELLEDIIKAAGNARLIIHYKSFRLDSQRFLKAIKKLKKPIFMTGKMRQVREMASHIETVFFGYPCMSLIHHAKEAGAKGFEFTSIPIPEKAVRETKKLGMYFTAAGYHPAWISQSQWRMNKAIRHGAKWIVVDDPISWRKFILKQATAFENS